MQRVIEVARLAGVHDEIQALTMQYNSLVGDMGSALSGGQKQRVLLARALYPCPKILFVDEGTAHLDPQCERHILKCLSDLEITRLVVTHRPLPPEMRSRVILVSGGQVREVARPVSMPEIKCNA